MLTTDYAQIHYKVSKRRLNVPYCSSSYPLLKKELFYFILLNNFNVIRFEPVVFEPNQLGISHKF